MPSYPPMKMSDPRFIERIKDVQRALGFSGRDVDGKVGHNTLTRVEGIVFPAEAIPDPVPVPPAEPFPAPEITGVDARSARNIQTLNPKVRGYFEAIVHKGTAIARNLGADSYVLIGGSRTYAEQNALYAQGRTSGGKVVTNARGGYSNHNFGIAGDFGVFGSGGAYLDNSNPALASRIHKSVAAWATENLPIEWGGNWSTFKDEPHYQFKTGLSTSQMRAKIAAGDSII
jgi:peptidoglycan LD-endopeptidase CwlK